MPMTTICRKVATACFLEIGLELLFSSTSGARKAWQPSLGPWVLWDRVLWAAMAPQHPPTAHGPTDHPSGWAGSLKGAAPACQLNGGKATEIKL